MKKIFGCFKRTKLFNLSFFKTQNIGCVYRINKMNFTDLKKGSPPTNEELTNYMNEEFERIMSTNDADVEKRVKYLSMKLLQCKTSKEVMMLFDEKYLKGIMSAIYGEELTLFIYFYISLIDKEYSGDSNTYRMNTLIDKRLDKAMNRLVSTMNELDITNLLALSWSISILISKFNYKVPLEFKYALLAQLPTSLEIDKKGEIPSLCFSISNYTEENNDKLNKLIQEKISQYSNLFFSDSGLNYVNSLNLSLLAVSWATIRYIDDDLLNSTAVSLLEIKDTLNQDNIDEICKILWTYYIFNRPNENLSLLVSNYLEVNLPHLSVNNIIEIFNTYIPLYPDNYELIEELIACIFEKYEKESDELVLDIGAYINMWLSLSKYYIKSGKNALEGVSLLLKFLISVYDKRPYLNAKNMNQDDISSLLVCFSVLNLEPNGLYSDLCHVAKSRIDQFNNQQLIQLISCGKYLFKTKKHSDLYFYIHDACVNSKERFDNDQLKFLKKVISADGVITQSPFIKS